MKEVQGTSEMKEVHGTPEMIEVQGTIRMTEVQGTTGMIEASVSCAMTEVHVMNVAPHKMIGEEEIEIGSQKQTAGGQDLEKVPGMHQETVGGVIELLHQETT